MQRLPNVIIFNPDSWRGDVLGHVGNPAAVTPNLDRVAVEDGVSFRNAFCQNPVCTPSRCSFMSGWHPHVRGHRTMFHMLHPERGEPNLLKRLKDAGYYVLGGVAGRNDLVPAQPWVRGQHCDLKFAPPRDPVEKRKRSTRGCMQWRGQPDKQEPGTRFLGGRVGGQRREEIYYDGD